MHKDVGFNGILMYTTGPVLWPMVRDTTLLELRLKPYASMMIDVMELPIAIGDIGMPVQAWLWIVEKAVFHGDSLVVDLSISLINTLTIFLTVINTLNIIIYIWK